MQNLPLFSHPATTVLIDDNLLFLKSVSLMFCNDCSVKTFSSPKKLMQFFGNYNSILDKISFVRSSKESEDYGRLHHAPIDLEISLLKKLRYDVDRKLEVAVLVVDYNMPEMNGIELCRELQSFPMKKVLLTGEAEHAQAIAAFNEGIIDCFIQKGTESIDDDIIFYTKKLSQQYFSDITKPFLSYLEADGLLPFSDPKFIRFFCDWCVSHHIVEYYLIDKNGSLLLLNECGDQFYFVIHTERSLNHFVELHMDDKDAEFFVHTVNSREKIPFFGEDVESWELHPNQWTERFFLPQVLEGRVRYYWAVVNK